MGRRYKGIRTSEGKTCADCKQFKNFDQYYKNATERDGLVCYCKDCYKARDWRRYKEGHGDKLRSTRKELKAKYIKKMGGQCARCGYKESIAALDFHHTENKEDTVSNLVSYPSLKCLGLSLALHSIV
jgi:hypothetical protein